MMETCFECKSKFCDYSIQQVNRRILRKIPISQTKKRESFSSSLKYPNTHQWISRYSIADKLRQNLENYSKNLVIDNRSDFINYLMKNLPSIDSLFDIVYKIIHLKNIYFGKSAQLILTVNHDPEFSYEFLKFNIRLEYYPEDFRTTLNELRNEYFPDLKKNNIWILVKSDFKPP